MKANDFSIVFIGTSSGKTSLKRFHSSLLVKSPAFNLLIDCGDGTAKALLSQGISLDLIDGILFSHLHPDHSAGFASLIVQMKQLKRTKKLKMFCHKKLVETLRMFLHNSFVFTETASFELEFCEFEHEEEIFLNKDFKYLSVIDTLSKKMGFIPSRLPESSTWKKDVPVLIVHAGKDFVPNTDESLTVFLDKAVRHKVPFTLIHYATGVHGFDIYADNTETREIIKATLEFWKFHLK